MDKLRLQLRRGLKGIRMKHIEKVYGNIKEILEEARNNAFRAVNFAMVRTYWQIGKVIVEEEQRGDERARYGETLIKQLSVRLTNEFGKGFTERNLWYIRNFYLKFSKLNALRSELSWTHYRLLLKIEKENSRQFYLQESINNNWSTRELERQISSLLYERIALSSDKRKIKELSKKGSVIKKPEDAIKDPYILEFLGVSENKLLHESELEELLIHKLRDFLLELGKGFSFVDRQKRITIDGDYFYIDLVFYNYILKCFILIDLKVGKLTHQDIGQMDFYVRYFEKEKKRGEDNPTIGLILCSDKNEAMAKYTILDESKNLFASKYELYLPTENELKEELTKERDIAEQEKRLKE